MAVHLNDHGVDINEEARIYSELLREFGMYYRPMRIKNKSEAVKMFRSLNKNYMKILRIDFTKDGTLDGRSQMARYFKEIGFDFDDFSESPGNKDMIAEIFEVAAEQIESRPPLFNHSPVNEGTQKEEKESQSFPQKITYSFATAVFSTMPTTYETPELYTKTQKILASEENRLSESDKYSLNGEDEVIKNIKDGNKLSKDALLYLNHVKQYYGSLKFPKKVELQFTRIINKLENSYV